MIADEASDAPVARGSLRVLTFAQAEQEDRVFWHSKSPVERLRHQERLREMNYGVEILDQGLQRVLAVPEQSRG